MFLKHLISPKPSIIFFFIFFCFIFVVFPAINCNILTIYSSSYFHPIILLVLGFFIPFFLSLGLNNIIYEKNIIRKENLVIGFVFILITCPFVNTFKVWISSFLLLFLFNFLLESYQKELPFSQFFNSSLILGVLTFIFPNLIFLILILIVSGINYSNISLRVILTILLGFVIPYIFYFVFIFLTDSIFVLPAFGNFSQMSFSIVKGFHLSKIIWLLVLFLVALFSFHELFNWLYKKSIKSRRTFMTIIWFFIITILIAIFSSWEYFYFAALPLSVIISNYLVYTKKRKIANILFSVLIISSFFYKYMIVLNL